MMIHFRQLVRNLGYQIIPRAAKGEPDRISLVLVECDPAPDLDEDGAKEEQEEPVPLYRNFQFTTNDYGMLREFMMIPTEGTEEEIGAGIVGFANKYGPSGIGPDHGPLQLAESVELWKHHIKLMRGLYHDAGLSQHTKPKVVENNGRRPGWRYIDKTGRVHAYIEGITPPDDIAPGTSLIWLLPGERRMIIGKQITKYHSQEDYKRQLKQIVKEQYLKEGLVPYLGDDERIGWSARSLLALLWYLFYLALNGEVMIVECKNKQCRNAFTIGGEKGRTLRARYCSDDCRARDHGVHRKKDRRSRERGGPLLEDIERWVTTKFNRRDFPADVILLAFRHVRDTPALRARYDDLIRDEQYRINEQTRRALHCRIAKCVRQALGAMVIGRSGKLDPTEELLKTYLILRPGTE
ncbi:MAG: hypothetical protein ACYDCO_16045 [Armatimonadota bacterium]